MIKAETKAEELIRDLGINIPINPQSVCTALSTPSFKIEYSERPFETKDFCGMSIGNKNGAQIIVNSNLNPKRLLFTAAHEIGHIVLHLESGKKINPKCSSSDVFENEGKELEAEANQFASAFLMPRYLIHEKIKGRDLTWGLIEEIAHVHGTSLEATARRIINLTKDTCALIIHNNNQMWTPIKSKHFIHSIPFSIFPKNLEAKTYKVNGNSSIKLEECDSSDWGINLNSNKYNCYYSALKFENYKQTMTLLFIEEVDEKEFSCWEEPRFR